MKTTKNKLGFVDVLHIQKIISFKHMYRHIVGSVGKMKIYVIVLPSGVLFLPLPSLINWKWRI